jgi:eukaryotic-like serine/threonine-protein kinase
MGSCAIIHKMVQIGDQLDRYQLQRHLAQGGMSDIYQAFDLINRREVAIKIPDQTMIGNPAQYERFQRELEVMTTLNHPVILKGLASGKHNRIPYLVMEFVEGKTLRQMINTGGPIPVETIIDLVVKMADGMAYCHDNNVIHRDLKPENILITPQGQPVIMDFGLALTKGSHRVTYSNLSETMGTPDYMAPEQIDGQRGDARTDIYALGTILYEMLAGQTPFTGDNNLAIMAQHLKGSAPRVDLINHSISPEITAVVAKSIQRSPADRYPDMPSFRDALQHPETADLSILAQTGKNGNPTSLNNLQTLRVVLIAIGILVGLAAIAYILQTLR